MEVAVSSKVYWLQPLVCVVSALPSGKVSKST
jgi:hypothetical protein